MPVVRIDKKGFEKFCSFMGYVKFENGVSVESISMAEAKRLGAFTSIVDAETGEPISETNDLIQDRAKTVDDMIENRGAKERAESLEKARQAKIDAQRLKKEESKQYKNPEERAKEREEKKKEKRVAKKKEPGLVISITERPLTNYTAESLAELADSKGVGGLRELAKDHGIKGRSINELISGLMAKKKDADDREKAT